MKRIILDTDIGTDVDDAIALSLAALSPELRIEGVTTVHADAALRARIARRILDLAGRADIPVVAGASQPLQMPLPPNFHWMPCLRGHEGRGILSGEELQPSADPEATRDAAAHFILDKAHEHPGELALVAIGALTNVGRALQLEPRIAGHIHSITVMGGTVDVARFGWDPMLEVNLNCDPLATRLVFESGIPLTLVPMEVTTQVYLTPDQRAAMRAWGDPLANTLVTLMEHMLEGFQTFSEEIGASRDFYEGRTFLHDPLAVYNAFAAGLVTTQRMAVRIEIIDRVVRTVHKQNTAPTIWVCTEVDACAFVEFLLERLKRQVAAR